MKIVTTFAASREHTAGTSTALVPTMGALHAGHLSLVEVARAHADLVVMSVFVNPLQFDDPADLERYPRMLERDVDIAAEGGVDVVFAPDVAEMYPEEPHTRVRVAGAGASMEGAHRPGHFEGVATVVAKLFAGLQPDAAVFGRKDAQQVAVVRQMTLDLSFPVEIESAPTVRAPDGVAMSSRNALLTDDDRRRARHISAGLFAACDAVEAGERSGRLLESAVRSHLEKAGVEPEYVTLADAQRAVPVSTLEDEAFLAVAARVGSVRLIDNVFLGPDGSADRGVRLEESPMPGRP